MWDHGPPYPFHWTAVWPLIAIAIRQGHSSDTIRHAKRLFLPTQQAVPAELDTLIASAIREADAGREAAALRHMKRAIELASELAYL